MKTGYKTTEFWISLAMGLVTAVVGVFVAKGLMTTETSEAFVQIAALLVVAIVPLVLGWISTRYTHGRTAIKVEELRYTTVFPGAADVSHNDLIDNDSVERGQ